MKYYIECQLNAFIKESILLINAKYIMYFKNIFRKFNSSLFPILCNSFICILDICVSLHCSNLHNNIQKKLQLYQRQTFISPAQLLYMSTSQQLDKSNFTCTQFKLSISRISPLQDSSLESNFIEKPFFSSHFNINID